MNSTNSGWSDPAVGAESYSQDNSSQSPRRRRSFGGLMVAPAVVVAMCFGIYPVLILLQNSFGLGQVGLSETEGFTVSYFAGAFQSPRVADAVLNSVIVGIGAVIITVLLAIPLVLHLARRSHAGQSTALWDSLMTFPIVLPGIIIGFFSIILIGRNGLFASLQPILSGMAYTYLGLFIAYIFFSIPRVIGPLRGAAEMIDPELLDVAHSLGSSRVKVFLTITLPLILPAAVKVSGAAAAVALGGYGTVATLSEGIRLLPLDVVDSLNNGYNVATASAYAVILAVLTILCLVAGEVLSRLVKKVFE